MCVGGGEGRVDTLLGAEQCARNNIEHVQEIADGTLGQCHRLTVCRLNINGILSCNLIAILVIVCS